MTTTDSVRVPRELPEEIVNKLRLLQSPAAIRELWAALYPLLSAAPTDAATQHRAAVDEEPDPAQQPVQGEAVCDCGANADNRWPHHDQCSIYTQPPAPAVGEAIAPQRQWSEWAESRGLYPRPTPEAHVPQRRKC